MLKKLYNHFSNDIGIDLGTANTLVYVRGQGIVIDEPSIVAVNTKTGHIVAVGVHAKEMLGRTPAHIRSVRPLVEGVISDFEVTEEMLASLIQRAEKASPKFFKPRVVIGVPSNITNVEVRAVYDAASNAGAREVYIVEEPMAAAIGVGLPIFEPIGSMIVDIGGGNTDVAVISLGGIVRSKNISVAGDKLNQDIISYFRDEFKLLIGEKTAETIKHKVCAVVQEGELEEAVVRGRDLVSGLPKEIIVNDTHLREAVSSSIRILVEGIREVLENTPPEVLSDVMARGIVLVGGGALLQGIDTLIARVSKIPVTIASEPLSAVCRGCGAILENLEVYKSILVPVHDDE